MRLRICKRCGKQYETDKPNTYLCPSCSEIVHKEAPMRNRSCRECGNIFPGGPRAWYCPDCRLERKKEKDRIYHRTEPSRKLGSIDICQRCGKEYSVESGRQKYCKDCADIAVKEKVREHKREYARKNMDEMTLHKYIMRSYRNVCVICGNIFDSEKSEVTCSEECRKKLRKIRQDESDIKRGRRKSPPGIFYNSGLPKSGIVGITARRNGKWQATYKRKYIGVFDTVDDAVSAIEKYKEKLEDCHRND